MGFLMNIFSKGFFLKSGASAVVCIIAFAILFTSCTKKPEVDGFKQIQLNWNAVDEEAENAAQKDSCVIEITSKVMRDPVVQASKLVEIAYEVFYRVDENGELVFDGRCGDSRFSDFKECSWQATCGAGPASVVKFHNER
jgi:hypothetical protein